MPIPGQDRLARMGMGRPRSRASGRRKFRSHAGAGKTLARRTPKKGLGKADAGRRQADFRGSAPAGLRLRVQPGFQESRSATVRL